MNGRLVFTLMAAAVVGLVGCDDDKISSGGPAKVVVDFPNGIGNQWVYTVYDSLTGVLDTARVSITGVRTLGNGESARIWRCAFDGGEVDTHFVSIVGDTVKLYWGDSTECTGAGILTILFPMEKGRTWTRGADLLDSTTIFDKIQLVVPAGWFDNVYRLERKCYVPGYVPRLQKSTINYIAGIGIGGMYLFGEVVVMPPPAVNELWVLVRYDLVD